MRKGFLEKRLNVTLGSSLGVTNGYGTPDYRIFTMVGYVAPAGEYAGGGYEIDGFLRPFGLQRRFAIETEPRFVAAREDLLSQVAGRAATGARASAA